MENQEEKYGLSKEEAETVKDFPKAVDIGKLEVGKTKKYEVLEDVPRTVDWTDKATGQEQSTQVISVEDLETGLREVLFLSSKSLKREFYKIGKDKDHLLMGVTVIISVREYEHPKFGKTRAYTVQAEN